MCFEKGKRVRDELVVIYHFLERCREKGMGMGVVAVYTGPLLGVTVQIDGRYYRGLGEGVVSRYIGYRKTRI